MQQSMCGDSTSQTGASYDGNKSNEADIDVFEVNYPIIFPDLDIYDLNIDILCYYVEKDPLVVKQTNKLTIPSHHRILVWCYDPPSHGWFMTFYSQN